jgi:hypothetical protein
MRVGDRAAGPHLLYPGPVRPSLAALALAAAACTPPPAVDPSTSANRPTGPETASSGSAGAFDGCSGVFTAVFGWRFECDGTTVVTREGDDVEALLRGARESMRGAFAGPVEERRDPLQVGGAARKGMELSLHTGRKQVVAVGTAAVVDADGRSSRVVGCLARADEASQARCRQQLDELSTLPYAELPPAGVRLRARPAPAIAERPVVAPSDCHLSANDRTGLLDCGDAALGWNEPSDPRAIPSERDATIEDTIRKMQSSGARPPKRTTSACHVEGVAATCSVVRWPEATLTIGSAVVRGHSILAWCIARDASTSRICSDSVTTGASTSAVQGDPLIHDHTR